MCGCYFIISNKPHEFKQSIRSTRKCFDQNQNPTQVTNALQVPGNVQVYVEYTTCFCMFLTDFCWNLCIWSQADKCFLSYLLEIFVCLSLTHVYSSMFQNSSLCAWLCVYFLGVNFKFLLREIAGLLLGNCLQPCSKNLLVTAPQLVWTGYPKKKKKSLHKHTDEHATTYTIWERCWDLKGRLLKTELLCPQGISWLSN